MKRKKKALKSSTFLEFLTLYTAAKSLTSKCINQAVELPHSIARASMLLSNVPIKHIKTVRESSAGYDFSVIAYKSKKMKF